MKTAVPNKLGDMSELNSHDRFKTGLLRFFVETQRITKTLSQKVANRFLNVWPWPKKFQEPAFLSFVSTEPIPRIHGAQTYQRTRLWVPQFGKITYRIFGVLSQCSFSIAFFQTKIVHCLFFLHLGFAACSISF